MIGSRIIIEEIENKLRQIAHQNKEHFGHIVELTDDNDAYVVLGWGKDDGSNSKSRIRFNVIFGWIEDICGNDINLTNYDFFELSPSFIDDMTETLDHLQYALNESTKEEMEILNILNSWLDEF